MQYASAIFVILRSLPPYYGDHEAEPARHARLEMTAGSMDRAALYGACEKADPECDDRSWVLGDGKLKRAQLAAALIVVGRFESGYALHVHENRCNTLIGECDSGRARSPWQFQRTPLTRIQWWAYKGADPDSTDLAAYAAAKVLGQTFTNCGNWQGAFAQYATGNRCHWSHAEMRFMAYQKTLVELERLRALPEPETEDDSDEEGEDE